MNKLIFWGMIIILSYIGIIHTKIFIYMIVAFILIKSFKLAKKYY